MEWNKDTIRAFRKRLGLTQAQFAELLGTSRDLISNWENEKRNPSGVSRKLLTVMSEKEDLEKDIEKILSKKDRISKEEILAFREELGLNQAQFAEKLGRDLSTISYWESGTKSPDPESRRRIKVLAKEEGIELPFLAKTGKIPESDS